MAIQKQNEYRNKTSTNDILLNSEVSVLLSYHKSSILWQQAEIKKHNWNMCRVRERGISGPTRNFSNLSLRISQSCGRGIRESLRARGDRRHKKSKHSKQYRAEYIYTYKAACKESTQICKIWSPRGKRVLGIHSHH